MVEPARTQRAEIKSPRLLIAEDDVVTASMLEDILCAEGYRVQQVRDGIEAVEIATGDAPPDLVLLDVMMPRLDGFEVCRRLKEAAKARGQYLPVLMVTALAHREARLRGLSLGADDYVTKPFDRAEVMVRVRGLLTVKALHDEKAERYEDLRRLEQRQRHLTEFVVHDLKNPLTGLLANLQLLEREVMEASPRCRGFLRDARGSANKLMEMVTTLLDVARMEEGEMRLRAQPLSIAEVIQAASREFAALSRFKSLTLSVVTSPDLPVVRGDVDVLTRILGNLLTNAIKHSPPARAIRVAASYSPIQRRVFVRVEDQAPAIPEAQRESIFEKFARLEAPELTPGHGLGLTFCRLAGRAHGGDCWCEPGDGGGNAFVLALPA